jgi:hypothetical protein
VTLAKRPQSSQSLCVALWPFVLAVERRRGEALKLKNAIWAFIPSAKIICLSLLDRGDVLYAEEFDLRILSAAIEAK